MFRAIQWLVLVTALTVAFVPAAEAARHISRYNPYRSFNISGINYGSQRWERANRGRTWSTGRSGRYHFHYR